MVMKHDNLFLAGAEPGTIVFSVVYFLVGVGADQRTNHAPFMRRIVAVVLAITISTFPIFVAHFLFLSAQNQAHHCLGTVRT